jgi:hypothetical protein
MGRRLGLPVSWKRALGTSAARGRVTRSIGIPKTSSAQDRNWGELSPSVFGIN